MSKPFGILFLGGAKRVVMAQLFKQAMPECAIYSYEMQPDVPLALEGEVIIGLRWNDPDLYEDLRRVCADKGIRCIVPFVDGGVAVAAEFVRRFPDAGVFAPTSPDPAKSELMFDKILAAEAFEKAGLPIPPTYIPGTPCLRLIAKPRHGSASKGIEAITSLEALDSYLARANEYLIQERIDNRREYTVDCYVDTRTGHIRTASARVRIEVTGGEVSRSATVDEQDVEALARKAISCLNLRGAVTVQIIRDMDGDASRLLLMEINPRLGGGAVCSVYAGADIPAMILAEAQGKPTEPMDARPGVEIARYMADAVFDINSKILLNR